MEDLDELNAKVTAAILRAEEHDSEGAALWEAVAAAELELSRHKFISPAERHTAERGRARAMDRANMLRSVMTDQRTSRW